MNQNPFNENRISQSYQLDNYISLLSVVLWYLIYLFNFFNIFCNQTVDGLIRRRVLLRLVLVCTVCIGPIERLLGLYGFRGSSVVGCLTRDRRAAGSSFISVTALCS